MRLYAKMKLTESSEVFELVGYLGLGLEPLVSAQIVANWVLLGEGLGGCLAVAVGEQVLRVDALDVTGVAWDARLVDHVLGTAYPVLAVSRVIAVDHLVVIVAGNRACVDLDCLEALTRKLDWMYTLVSQNFSLDVAAGRSEPFHL